MTQETLEKDIEDATEKLLEMARNHTWNFISDDCKYILSEIDNSSAGNIFKLMKVRKKNNKNKNPRSLREIVTDLRKIYSNLYDLNLFVYKAKYKLTIIEVQYYLKSSLEKDYLEDVRNNDPMLHCKVAIPPYLNNNQRKFDINWQLGGIRYQWQLLWWRLKSRSKRVLRLH